MKSFKLAGEKIVEVNGNLDNGVVFEMVRDAVQKVMRGGEIEQPQGVPVNLNQSNRKFNHIQPDQSNRNKYRGENQF